MASVSRVMGTQQFTDQVYRSAEGKTFHNVAISEMMLSQKLLAPRIFDTASLQPSQGGEGKMDMSHVQKPIRGAEELAQIVLTESSSVCQVSEEGRLDYDLVLHQGMPPSQAIDRINQSRKLQHDVALKTYDQSVVDIAEELEEQVIEQCRYLRDDELVAIDATIATQFLRIEAAAVLQQMNHPEVLLIWEEMNALLLSRKNCVEKYAAFLMHIETQRSKNVGAALQHLAGSIVAVGYLLRDEAIRLIESRAFLINEVIVTNTRAFEDVIARLRRLHVEQVVRWRCAWAAKEYEWRQLRHQRAIDEFQTTLRR